MSTQLLSQLPSRFDMVVNGNTPEAAFLAGIQKDFWSEIRPYGLSTKETFTMVTLPDGVTKTPVWDCEYDYIDDQLDQSVFTSNGPAGCLDMGNGKYLFFGLTGPTAWATRP